MESKHSCSAHPEQRRAPRPPPCAHGGDAHPGGAPRHGGHPAPHFSSRTGWSRRCFCRGPRLTAMALALSSPWLIFSSKWGPCDPKPGSTQNRSHICHAPAAAAGQRRSGNLPESFLAPEKRSGLGSQSRPDTSQPHAPAPAPCAPQFHPTHGGFRTQPSAPQTPGGCKELWGAAGVLGGTRGAGLEPAPDLSMELGCPLVPALLMAQPGRCANWGPLPPLSLPPHFSLLPPFSWPSPSCWPPSPSGLQFF